MKRVNKSDASLDTIGEVSAAQHHYTSCKHGLAGHAGFQTRALSASINDEEKREIEQLGVYQLPRDTIPSVDQVCSATSSYPVAIRHKFLADGSLIITRSCYTGQDYSKREGNYFCHGLKIEQSQSNIWPVDIYYHSHWKEYLAEDEDLERDNWTLPELQLTPNYDAFNFLALSQFLNTVPNPEHTLTAMIQAIILGKTNSRSLIIKDNNIENGFLWIASLQKCFPKSLQSQISCSSYQFDPRTCQTINVVYGKTDITLGENEQKYQFYLFDFVDSQFSDINSPASLYANTVARWMVNNPETMDTFMAIAEQFKLNELNQNLDALTAFYLFCSDLFCKAFYCKEENVSDQYEPITALEFVEQHARPEYLADISLMLINKETLYSEVKSPQYFEKLAEFLLNHLARNDGEVAQQRLITLFFNQILKDIKTPETSPKRLDSYLEKIKQAHPKLFKQLSQKILDEILPNLKDDEFAQYNEHQLKQLCRRVFESLTATEAAEAIFDNTKWQMFLETLVPQHIAKLNHPDWLFHLFTQDLVNETRLISFICQIITHIDTPEKTNEPQHWRGLATGVYQNYKNRNNDWLLTAKALKFEQKCWPLLVANWTVALQKSGSKLDYFRGYFTELMNDESDYCLEYRLRFTEDLWNSTAPKERTETATFFLLHFSSDWLNHTLASDIADSANQAITFNKDIHQFIPQLESLVKTHKIKLKPNKVTLFRVCQTDTFCDTDTFAEIRTALEDSDIETYRSFTEAFIPRQLTFITTSEQHGAMLSFLCPIEQNQQDRIKDLIAQYKKHLSVSEKASPGERIDLFFEFWLSQSPDDPHYAKYQQLKPDLEPLLIAKLAKLSDRKLGALFKQLTDDSSFTAAQHIQAKRFENLVKEKKNTLLRKIGRSSLAGIKIATEFAADGLEKLYQKVRNRNG